MKQQQRGQRRQSCSYGYWYIVLVYYSCNPIYITIRNKSDIKISFEMKNKL